MIISKEGIEAQEIIYREARAKGYEHEAALAAALRPAPSQSEEERAQSIIEDVWDNVDGEAAKQVLIRALAEATLAGAAAEREECAKVASEHMHTFDKSVRSSIAAAIRARK